MDTMMDTMMKSIYVLGEKGPLILFFSSICLLYTKSTFVTIYIIGFVIDVISNYMLKGVFKQPRPNENIHIFNALVQNDKIDDFDRFGMPSGHSTSVFFSTIYIYFALKNTKITLFYLLLSMITMYDKLVNNKHSIVQVLVGAFIGGILGYGCYLYAEDKITKK